MVVGQAARDLVLRVDALPDAGASTAVHERIEVLGGKGANQAVALAQLGQPVTLVGVLGKDTSGQEALLQLERDGIDTSCVVRRGRTALLVDVVSDGGVRRLLEDVPAEALLRDEDLAEAGDLLASASTVSLQLQQPARVLLHALDRCDPDALVVLDGSAQDRTAGQLLLARADVLRLDAEEAQIVAGRSVHSPKDARELLELGPDLVAVGRSDGSNVVVWAGGDVVLPPGDVTVVDPTGGGDSFTAGLVAALRADRKSVV